MTDAPIILIVEDDDGARRALGELLEADGFAVREAATLAAAREAAIASDVAAILLDLRLPDGDGQELLVERGAGHVPIIVMTAFGSGSRAIEAMRAGAYDYVQKPLDPDEIGLTLRRALDHARLTSELARAQRHVDAPIAATERIVGTSTALQRVFKLIGRGAERRDRAHQRRIGNGQGARRERDPCLFGTGERPVRRDQLRSRAGGAPRERALRIREGRIHERDGAADRPLRSGGRRDALSR